MKNREATIRIGREGAGITLIDYLSRRFTYHDRDRWAALISEGKILRNGVIPHPENSLTEGDIVCFWGFDESEPPVCRDYQVVFEDDSLMVINKPGNLPCHPAGRYFRHTLWHILSEERKGASLHFINRIDRETSGLVLIAKTPKSANICRRQFDSGAVRKYYMVAVYGDFPPRRIRAEGTLCRDEQSLIRKKQQLIPIDRPHEGNLHGSYCRTDFRLFSKNGGLSLLGAMPLTGRMHQIRASIYSLGFPVVGDKLYGPDETIFLRFIDSCLTEKDQTDLILHRQALHSAYLQLPHPITGQPMAWSAPLPRDISGLFPNIADSIRINTAEIGKGRLT